MTTPIESLAAELLDEVVSYLDSSELRTLRIVSRTLSIQLTQGPIRKLFESKTLPLTTESLGQFGSLIDQSALVRSLRHLTLVGPRDLESVSSGKSLESTALLDAFTKLDQHSKHVGLQSLTLKVATNPKKEWIPGMGPRAKDPVDPWRKVWKSAEATFSLTMMALGESQLRVGRLDVFGSLPRCSLAIDRVGAVLAAMQSMQCLRTTKYLSLSLSDHYLSEKQMDQGLAPHPPVDDGDDHVCNGSCFNRPQPDPVAIDPSELQENVRASVATVRQFLASFPSLESLELHYFRIGSHANAPKEIKHIESHFFDEIAPDLVFPRLCSLILRGPCLSEDTLLSYLKSHPTILNLSLEAVHINPGNYKGLFTHIAGPNRDIHLQRLELDDVTDGLAGRVHFDAPGSPKYPWQRDHFTGQTQGPSNLILTGEELQRPIVTREIRGRHLGSGQFERWRRAHALRFGPM